MILINVSITQLDASNETVWYQLSHVDGCIHVVAHVVELSDTTKAYHPLPKYPAMSRDIALVVDENMTVGEIEDVIKHAGAEILKGVKLFDIYRGKQIGEGKKSVAFALTYRNNDRTLTDEDVQAAHSKVLDALKEKLDINLREM